jgi:acetyltransferase-like isoleucine patch superfamily enzyme
MREIEIIGPGTIEVGRVSNIGESVRAIFSRPARIVIGDYVTIGDGTKFIVDGGSITIGDWSTLHDDITVLCKGGVSIGQHCWFGQQTVIDGTGGMQIENGVRAGMYSQLWSHVAAGEQIEGCTLCSETPTSIEADVWLVGTCFVASGVTVGRRTVALSGANITKDFPANSVVAGAPARLREGVSFYREVTVAEKFAMLEGWLRDFCLQGDPHVRLVVEDDTLVVDTAGGADGRVVFHRRMPDVVPSEEGDAVTHCCLTRKTYSKAFTPLERRVLKYLSGNKARFYSP